jgi:hypothetical protein
MARLTTEMFTAALATFLCLGQVANGAQASQAPAPPSATAPANNSKPRGAVPVELTNSLDSKKLKAGDPVTARITADLHMRSGETIPRGSKLTGHVTEAKARSNGDPQAALGITFDKITIAHGNDILIKGVLQAVGPSLSSSGQPEVSVGGPGMMPGHEGQGVGTTPPPMGGLSQTQETSKPVLNARSEGVVGIRNLELGENSVLRSGGKEVRLDSGTQMIVQIEIE